MDYPMKTEVEGRLSNLLDIIEAGLDCTRDAVWWGPIVGSDEDPSPDSASGIGCWGPVIGADELPPPPA